MYQGWVGVVIGSVDGQQWQFVVVVLGDCFDFDLEVVVGIDYQIEFVVQQFSYVGYCQECLYGIDVDFWIDCMVVFGYCFGFVVFVIVFYCWQLLVGVGYVDVVGIDQGQMVDC